MFYRPTSTWSWSFLLLAIVQSCVVLGLEGFVFAAFQNNLHQDFINKSKNEFTKAQTRTIPTYLTLFIFGHIFLVVLCYDALRLKNTIQIIGICIFNAALLLYAAIQMDQIHDANTFLTVLGVGPDPNAVGIKENIWPVIQPSLIAIPCVIALSTVLMCVICWKLYDEFAWTIYKHISADLKMKERYLKFQIFIALLKFDFFFFVGFTVQFIVIVASTSNYLKGGGSKLGNTDKDYEFFLTIAVLPLTIAFLVLAAWCTRREKKIPMVFIIIIFFAALAYFIFKLVRMYHGSFVESYKPAKRSLTTFAAITLILIILTIANAIACVMNFDKGLKPHITRRKMTDEEEKHSMTEMTNQAAQPIPSRMTID
ncbi:unnamed protein product [Tuber melanosporum]|uniref:(Perigord truffle) hypothetical protein n=1 Tax=Tuber melanosporum (strain Mel28) TaxID=656061 RepID=D5G9W8_TUBMM|nr:uncharacterized protein GSTUM_00005108001 [Tuber melanosporum]KAG0138160.1 hypothetical protein HOY82DRAFT_292667 [Tuber indicum]CAZ81311.1 unnamed protein product [Tuber melanosporum]